MYMHEPVKQNIKLNITSVLTIPSNSTVYFTKSSFSKFLRARDSVSIMIVFGYKMFVTPL